LEKSEKQLPKALTSNLPTQTLKVDAEERQARTLEEMTKEATWLRSFFPNNPVDFE
jgi:hypothetical protein